VDTLRIQLNKEVSNSTIKVDREVSSVKSQLDTRTAEVDTLRTQLKAEQESVSSAKDEVNTIRVQLDRTTTEVNTLRAQLKSATTEANMLRAQQITKETNETESEDATKVIHLDTNRAKKSGQDEKAIEEQIRALLEAEPGLLGRAIARRVGCSPTTASKWKELIENERKEA
jgi:chromosome segregation ATPase